MTAMNQPNFQDELANVLLAPLVSEKGTRSGERENSVLFKVALKATKPQIKQAVETFFKGVKVKAVRTSIRGRRQVRFGQVEGRSKKKKIAFVTLEAGSQINFAEFE